MAAFSAPGTLVVVSNVAPCTQVIPSSLARSFPFFKQLIVVVRSVVDYKHLASLDRPCCLKDDNVVVSEEFEVVRLIFFFTIRVHHHWCMTNIVVEVVWRPSFVVVVEDESVTTPIFFFISRDRHHVTDDEYCVVYFA